MVEFRKALDPEITYDRIDSLFKACDEWPGIFKPGEDIDLAKRHLQVRVGPIEGVRLMGSNLRIMDDAFEYLLPTEAKKKKGQFFTPCHVVEMCVRMLNPKRDEYVMDPACGSGGFLLHAMDWCYPAADNDQRELRKHRYASKRLWGIDFEQRAAKTSRALMLIAGDGHTNYAADIKTLLAAHAAAADVPEDAIPEAVADLIAETFSEPEVEAEDTTNRDGDGDNGDDEATAGVDEDPVALAEERLKDLKAALLKAKQRLMDLESDREALEQRKDQEMGAIQSDASGIIPHAPLKP